MELITELKIISPKECKVDAKVDWRNATSPTK
jgi:hypothetical protein